MPPVQSTKGTTVQLPENSFVPQAGKTFRAWSIDGEDYQPGDEYLVTGSVTIPAAWEDSPVEAITISFDKGNGDGTISPETVLSGSIFTFPANKFTPPTGMEFAGWSVDGTQFMPGDVSVLTKNVTVIALWQERVETSVICTVIWLNGDGSELDRKTYEEGQTEPATDKIPIKTEDTDNTYIFSKWTLDKTEGNVKTYIPEFTVTAKAVTISDVRVIGQEVRAVVSCSDTSATAFCAVYSDSGKMVALEIAPITGSNDYAFSFVNCQFDSVKVMILDSNLRALCASTTN